MHPASRALFFLLAFGILLSTGCTSDLPQSESAPVKQQAQADSATTGTKVEAISGQLSSVKAWAYFSVFVSLVLFSVVAGLIWVLWSQGKEVDRLTSKLERIRKKLDQLSKNALTKDGPRRKTSGVSRNEKRELQNQIISIEDRLRKIERNIQSEEQLQKERKSSSEVVELPDVEWEPGSEAEEENGGATKEKGGGHGSSTRSFHDRNQNPAGPGSLERDFNRVESGELRQKKFEEEHDPVRLGIQNEEERLNDENAPVLLHRDDRGQYLAVEKDGEYLAVPNFDVILQDADRREAGIDEVFGCGEDSYNHPYEVQRVEKAARLNQRPDSIFALEKSGKIHLQRYD
jgi:hypothetical protein